MLDFDLHHSPYAGVRRPTLGANGAVATSHPAAASAGLAILQAGGNAIDAAVAAAIALTVVEPTMNGIGGDAFALIWDGQQLQGYNGSGAAPKLTSLDTMAARAPTEAEYGWPVVTVPGAPAAWQDLHQRYGSMDIAQLFAPAIQLAEDGFAINQIVARGWAQAVEVYRPLQGAEFAGWWETFAPQRTAPVAGDLFYLPDHAASLRRLAQQGIGDFYHGQIAQTINDFSLNTGGWLREADLQQHRGEWVEPLQTHYRGHQVCELPPNGQGIAALIALGLLEPFDLAGLAHGDEACWHLQIEAMKLAFADVYRHIAEPSSMQVTPTALLAADYLATRRALIGDTAADPKAGALPKGGTVYLCTADRDGRMVSYIQSNYAGFGSGIVIPGTGIALHNRGAGFSLDPQHPNCAAPGKRPRHTIIPGFLMRDGEPVGPFGVMGAPMQPQGHVQVISSTLDHGLNPQAALDAPRWRVEPGLEVLLEPHTPQDLVEQLGRRGHRPQVQTTNELFGHGQIIWRHRSGCYAAGSEGRADGYAAVF